MEQRGEEGERQGEEGEESVSEGQGPAPITNDTPEKLRRSRRKRMEVSGWGLMLMGGAEGVVWSMGVVCSMFFNTCHFTSSPPPPLPFPSQDPDYAFELNEDNPEFKKLAFVSPGVKNSFAPLKRSARTCFGKKEKGMNQSCNCSDIL